MIIVTIRDKIKIHHPLSQAKIEEQKTLDFRRWKEVQHRKLTWSDVWKTEAIHKTIKAGPHMRVSTAALLLTPALARPAVSSPEELFWMVCASTFRENDSWNVSHQGM